MKDIPSQPGAYLLHLRLPEPSRIAVGKLGQFQFPPGDYIYLGSALGPGGIKARLNRHRYGYSKQFWHIDYLRTHAWLVGFAFVISNPASIQTARFECVWSQSLLVLPGASVITPGFGASDCKSGCKAHLIGFAKPVILERLAHKLRPVSAENPIYFTDWIG
jgi:Uri superfamily endonuclease